MIVDLFGQRVINSPRLTSRIINPDRRRRERHPRRHPVRQRIVLDLGRQFRLEGQRRAQMLVTFNLRFAIADGGLTDRLSPLLGVEWAF